MSNPSNDIEERLVPFVEGVLNAREEAEVRKALEQDPDLVREVEELRQTIDSVRTGFASGVKPPQTELTPEEVVELAAHDGKLETMPGSSELKAKLFSSDQALEEYRLLQSLRNDALDATMDMSDVPPMPEALRKEFQALRKPEPSKVVEFSNPSFWQRTTGFFERINPKPLMATAAALAMLTLGVHLYQAPQGAETSSGDTQVAMGNRQSPEPPVLGQASPAAATAADKGGKAPNAPSGVIVFTSDDKELLREQAEKLLAKKVRYTVTEDRILVSEKELETAKEALWGEKLNERVAMAEETKREAFKPAPEMPKEPGDYRAEAELAAKRPAPPAPKFSANTAQAAPAKSDSSPKSMQRFDYRTSKSRITTESEKEVQDPKPAVPPTKNTEKPASKQEGDVAPVADVKPPAGRAAGFDKSKAKRAPETANERRDRLKRLALGQGNAEPEAATPPPADEGEGSEAAPPPEPNKVTVTVADDVEADQTAFSRARKAPAPPVEAMKAPVANVITKDLPDQEVASSSQGVQDEGTVASENAPTQDTLEAATIDIEEEAEEIEDGALTTTGSVAKPSAPASSPKRRAASRKAAKINDNYAAAEAAPAPGALRSIPRPAPSGGEAAGGLQAQARVASIRSSQPAVARKYNVVLSVEQRGSQITVYVRPRGELNKSEIAELRKAIRSELGLAANDSVVFR